ncbi:MAG: aldo/keto reductase [Acetobacteraceae bacterium]
MQGNGSWNTGVSAGPASKVPVLSFGTGTFGGKGEFFAAWGTTDVKEAARLVDICLEAGLTMFDSADVYSAGAAEEILGEAVKGRRNQVLISTKATFRRGDGPNDVGSSRFHLIEAVDAALRRLQTDHIDLFQLHGFDALTPVAEVLLDAGRPRPGGEDPLCRLLELLGLAPDEVACRWPSATTCRAMSRTRRIIR